MEAQQSTEVLKDSMDSGKVEKQEFFPPDSEVKNVSSSIVSKEVIEIPNQDKCGLEIGGDNIQLNKNLNVREVHETSPFKQAVRGFVLSKLTGLTEKLAKKLEDNKDNSHSNSQSVSVHSSESDLSISSLKMKEMPSEIISTSASCELKSVVANDLPLSEMLSIEDAMECVEEPKPSANDIDIDNIGIDIPIRLEIRSNSISLPSSPAHRFSKRASSVSYSLENMKLSRKDTHSPDLSFLCEENKDSDNVFKIEKNDHKHEIKLKEEKKKTTDHGYDDKRADSEASYLCNIYSGDKEDKPEFKMLSVKGISLVFLKLKRILSSLSLTHFFLLASIIIHNLSMISYLTFIFDGMIIAYVLYSYICILAQTPIPSKSQNFPFVDPHLENASIHVQKANRFVKATVKILKGEYDPDMVKNHPTDFVDISIENCCLKIYIPKKKSSKNHSEKLELSATYDLLGAKVSTVPNGLSKGRIWNKKYPICIALPLVPKKSESPDSINDATVDYLSPPSSSQNEASNQKALYFFALTDREKESLFWVLLRNTEDSDNKCNEPCDTSVKSDFSSMSYTSLLELNGEDSTLQSQEDENSSISDKANRVLTFENYMSNLFENYERMNRLHTRSKSFTDLTDLKEDSLKSSDPFISKDDSFLTYNTKEYPVDWLNLVLGRIFYDFLSQKHWSDDVKSRIQKKLDKIEMPSFIESLEVSEVFLGANLPQIHTLSNLEADMNGVWLNCDFNYCGSFQMTLTARLKMTKANQFHDAESVKGKESKQNAISSESSDEEETESKTVSSKKKRLINRIEKWISYKHFQTVAQSRFVKKYVGDLSNMPLTLTVELNTLHGTLTLNIPPAPTDRIWYGFRKDPVLSLNAYPKVGTHEINLSAIVHMVEKKLVQEFKKAVVMPNMDFLLIPVMYTPVYEL